LPHVHLIHDRPEDASREGNEAIREWSQQRWLTHHWCNAIAQANAALYAMRIGDALAGLERDVPEMQRALQMRLQTLRIQVLDVRCRIFSAAAAEKDRTSERRDLIASALRDATQLEKEGLPWATALATVARAATFKAGGDQDRALAFYTRARTAFAALDMAVHELGARFQVAQLEGGDQGRAETTTVIARMRERGVASPERFLRMLVP
jgi:hypothetical protein